MRRTHSTQLIACFPNIIQSDGMLEPLALGQANGLNIERLHAWDPFIENRIYCMMKIVTIILPFSENLATQHQNIYSSSHVSVLSQFSGRCSHGRWHKGTAVRVYCLCLDRCPMWSSGRCVSLRAFSTAKKKITVLYVRVYQANARTRQSTKIVLFLSFSCSGREMTNKIEKPHLWCNSVQLDCLVCRPRL